MPELVDLDKRIYKQGVDVKDLYSSFIALLPVLMIFNVPFVNIGLSTALVLLLLPYVSFSVVYEKSKITAFVLCFLCFGYMILRTLGSSYITVVIYVSIIIHILGFFSGTLNYVQLRKTIEKTSVVLTALVLIQIAAFYVFGVKFTYLVEDFIIPDEQYMVQRFLNSDSLFRPSAIFLEPAHYAQYTCIGLISTLFPCDNKDKVNVKQALWIAFGCMLTRSGIGFILMSAIAISYIFFHNRKDKKNIMKLLGGLFALVLVFWILSRFQFVQDGLQRIFGEYKNGNAIWGRTVKYGEYIKPMAGVVQLVGFGGKSKPADVYMTGFMETVYNYGYLGFGLLVTFLLYCSLKRKNIFSFLVFALYVGLMFAADVTGFVNVLFFTSFILMPSFKKSVVKNLA